MSLVVVFVGHLLLPIFDEDLRRRWKWSTLDSTISLRSQGDVCNWAWGICDACPSSSPCRTGSSNIQRRSLSNRTVNIILFFLPSPLKTATIMMTSDSPSKPSMTKFNQSVNIKFFSRTTTSQMSQMPLTHEAEPKTGEPGTASTLVLDSGNNLVMTLGTSHSHRRVAEVGRGRRLQIKRKNRVLIAQ